MENIENRLENYRLRKRRQEKIHVLKENCRRFLMFGVKNSDSGNLPDEKTLNLQHDTELSENVPTQISGDEIENDEGSTSSCEDEQIQSTCRVESNTSHDKCIKYTLRIVYIAFWITLYILAIELQFGIVFLMISALAGLYWNTRTGPKQRDEISAYSVFNKNCESIEGTLKAEQFEREIGIR